jgi:hypothetical protein
MILAAVLALWQFLKQCLFQQGSLLCFTPRLGTSVELNKPKLELRRSDIPEVIWEQLYRRQHELLFAEVMYELCPSNLECRVPDCVLYGTKTEALCTMHKYKNRWHPDDGLPVRGPFSEEAVLEILGLDASTHFMPDARLQELKAQLQTFPLAAYARRYRREQIRALFQIEQNLSVHQAIELWKTYYQRGSRHGGTGYYEGGHHFGYHFGMLLQERRHSHSGIYQLTEYGSHGLPALIHFARRGS